MSPFDTFAMVGALVIMFAAIGARIITTQLLNRLQATIAAVNQSRARALGELRLAQSRGKVAQQNRAMLDKKKARLNKKLSRQRRTLSELRQQEDLRRQQRDSARGRVVRDPGDAG